ncbi:uncharacterized protein PODANS_2_7610 [Podospora anserina S mat+]|uniref:Podospora anserina S mat+ genomic DNA chromosome 2, supercontig 2 n=1 Tax=Podospora anserina (strain S / ATCC MYA-4624 / DSM 980 / FGSC 10383) TaxID=515849 RepID=B2B6F2_PODAN|nr:uncharacterized protein PODANS_2_7610 [Podospora anserina S mat+]CAP73377.1 unnamed protein product [Podospora anserina S mat+]CDP25780.1 Putative protein of unknown function [Podospora anserina S mat+]
MASYSRQRPRRRSTNSLPMKQGVSSAPSPSTDEAPNGIAGYNIVDVSWDLPVKLDDPTSEIVTVTGTIEEAIAQMEAAYPGWNETFQAGIPTDPMPTGDDTSFVSAGTADEQPESINCKVDYDGARTSKIWDGICYLRRLNTDPPKNGPGPGNCGRVSCSWKSAIYWCNDVSSPWLWVGG